MAGLPSDRAGPNESPDQSVTALLIQKGSIEEPANASEWHSLGESYRREGRLSDAEYAFRRAIELQPQSGTAYEQLGKVYWALGNRDTALFCFDRAIEYSSDNPSSYISKGKAFYSEGLIEQALATYEAALVKHPDHANLHERVGVLRLMLGDFVRGWSEYQWRWKTGQLRPPPSSLKQWDGTSLVAKSIWLTPEQGLGDTIQFIRYATWLKEKYDCRVYFTPPRALTELLQSCAGIDKLVGEIRDLPYFDCMATLIGIPTVCRHTQRDFPAKTPYLACQTARINEWRQRLAQFTRPRIGIVWRGSPKHPSDKTRSIPVAACAALKRLHDVDYFLLQKHCSTHEIYELVSALNATDLGSDLDERTGAFVETAAVLSNIDLLITCDTSIAHLGGALGIPVWICLANVPDWRWGLQGRSSPWYPTAVLFRQPRPGDWKSVFGEIINALQRQFPRGQ